MPVAIPLLGWIFGMALAMFIFLKILIQDFKPRFKETIYFILASAVVAILWVLGQPFIPGGLVAFSVLLGVHGITLLLYGFYLCKIKCYSYKKAYVLFMFALFVSDLVSVSADWIFVLVFFQGLPEARWLPLIILFALVANILVASLIVKFTKRLRKTINSSPRIQTILCVFFLALFFFTMGTFSSLVVAGEDLAQTATLSVFWVIILFVGIVSAFFTAIIFYARSVKEKHTIQLKEEELEALVSKHHKYKEVVPSVLVSSEVLLDALSSINDKNRMPYLEKMKTSLAAVNQMAGEISEEFEVDRLDKTLEHLMLPEKWLPLEIRLRQVMQQCERKDISIYIKNTATNWDAVPVTIMRVTRLVGNLLSNAVKELEKTDGGGKQVIVQFSDQGDSFAVELRDNAHEFSVEILARLGERKNSTNNTGDGYAEIFKILEESRASFEIVERQEQGRSYKTVRVTFDGKAERVILTGYRYELLQKALAGTGFVVEE